MESFPIGMAQGEPSLRAEYAGPAQSPAIASETIGAAASVSLAMSQPMFPSHFQLHNTWGLSLPGRIPLRLTLDLHEASLSLDMRGLVIDSLDVKADAGPQEIIFGRPSHKLSARLYSSSSDLTIVLPARTHARLRLLNPFCRVDYPQGDLEKRDDGSLVSTSADPAAGTIDVAIDGPIKNLVLDVEDAPAARVPAARQPAHAPAPGGRARRIQVAIPRHASRKAENLKTKARRGSVPAIRTGSTIVKKRFLALSAAVAFALCVVPGLAAQDAPEAPPPEPAGEAPRAHAAVRAGRPDPLDQCRPVRAPVLPGLPVRRDLRRT